MKTRFITIEGIQDTLHVYDHKLTITPRGLLGFFIKGLKGTKELPFRSIIAIQLKLAGITHGFIQFTISGGNESSKGIFSAVEDENTFFFSAKENATIQNLKQFIEERMTSNNEPTSVLVAQSKADELAKIVNLKKSGVISEEEFQALKSQIIGQTG